MALTRIKTDQITDLAVTNAKISNLTIEGGKLANNLTYGSNFTVSGNLTVNGTTTTVDTANTVAADPLIVLNRSATGANTSDLGLLLERGSDVNVAIIWDESADEFVMVSTNETGSTAGNIAITAYQGLRLGKLDVDNLQLDGSTLASTNTNGNIDLDTNGTGTVRILGAGAVTGNLSVDGNVTLGNASGDGHTVNGSLTVTNGLSVTGGDNTLAGNLTVNGNVTLGNSAADLITVIGNLDIQGGDLYMDNLRLHNNTISSLNTNGEINLDPNGTGNVIVKTGANFVVEDLTAGRVVFVGTGDALADNANFTYNSGTGNLVVNGIFNADNLQLDGNTLASTNANGNINITPNGTGEVILATLAVTDLTSGRVPYVSTNDTIVDSSNLTFDGSTLTVTGTSTVSGQFNADNLRIDGNTISSTNTNGNIALDPNGTGVTTVASDVYITGNLYVTGTETIFNVIASSTEDPVLHVGGAADASILTSNDGMDRGIEFHHYDTQDRHGFFGFDNSTGEFTFIPQATEGSLNIYTGTEGTARFGNVKVVSLTSNRVVYVGASDQLVDSANLTFDGTTLSLTGTLTTTGQLNVDNLRLDGNTLSSTNTNGNIDITANGSGIVNIDNLSLDGNTLASTNANGNINITANGTGVVNVDNLSLDGNTLASTNANGNINITANGTGTVNIDNVIVDGNSIKTLDTNGSLTFDPNGTGNVVIASGAELRVTDLTDTRVVFVGPSGALKDNANFTYNSGTGRVSITGSLDVDNININGSTISTSVTNENLTITANGTGTVIVESLQINGTDVTTSSSEISINNAQADVNFRVATDTNANTLFVDGGNNNIGIRTASPNAEAVLHLNTTNSMIIPVGTVGQRPSINPVIGMFRYNTTSSDLEVYDGTDWVALGLSFTVATSETFTGDGSTSSYTISYESTSAASIVSINGVVQIPVTAYGITGTTLTFTEAPESGDVIEVRKLTTLSTVTYVSSSNGQTSIEVERNAGEDIVRITAAGVEMAQFDNSAEGTFGYFDLINKTKTTYDQTAVTAGTSPTVIDSFAKATYRSAKYVIQVANSGGTSFDCSEVLVVHNGTTAYMTEYAVINTGASLGTVSVAVNGANVELSYTGAAASNAVKVYATYIKA